MRYPFSDPLKTEGDNVLRITGLGGVPYRLARDAIVDAWSAAWPGWSFVQMRGAAQPVLVRASWHRVHAAHRPPKRRMTPT